MNYAARLRKMFPSIKLVVEDILFLESFQIAYLPNRVPRKEFAVFLNEYPFIKKHLLVKQPSVAVFFNSLAKEFQQVPESQLVSKYCDEVLWEIAELIIYNKHPELYDQGTEIAWELEEFSSVEKFKNKIVIDAGAGSGRLSFIVAPYSQTVFALEPVSAFRKFIKEKAIREQTNNIFTMDGFLDSIPLPDNSADILLTSNAIGWNLHAELSEIERILKPGGQTIHLLWSDEPNTENPLHEILSSEEWNYSCASFENQGDLKLKYAKTMS